MARLNGWKRLFFVFLVTSAIGSYVLAYENVNKMRISLSREQDVIRQLIAEDSKKYPCIASADTFGCGQQIGQFTKEAIEQTKRHNDELQLAIPKLFGIYFSGSLICVWLLFQAVMFVQRGFCKK